MKRYFALLFFMFILTVPYTHVGAATVVLTKEEREWLTARNNTITVIPERNTPPFSFTNDTHVPRGMFIDYAELVAEKLGVRVEYLTARTRLEVIKDLQDGKGDYIGNLGLDRARRLSLLFNTPYASFPAVIVVRKDYPATSATLDDFSNKRVAVVGGATLESYIAEKNPKIIIEQVVDNELGIQKVVLAEVDAVVMNTAALAYFMGQQRVSSLKILSSLPDYKVEVTFAVGTNKQELHSILEKGLTAITPAEHELLQQKWILVQKQQQEDTFLAKLQRLFGVEALYILLILAVLFGVYAAVRRIHRPSYVSRKIRAAKELKEEVAALAEELRDIKEIEKDIEDKIDKLQ